MKNKKYNYQAFNKKFKNCKTQSILKNKISNKNELNDRILNIN